VKLVRCTVQPNQVDDVVDALKAEPILGLTVTGGGGWHRQQEIHHAVYRGCKYEVRLLPSAVIDVTASDDAVDDVVRVVMKMCSVGATGDDGRILVMPVEESYSVRIRPRRSA
jgi:nitrogen regulatory protein PII